jgi:hypothetical protein
VSRQSSQIDPGLLVDDELRRRIAEALAPVIERAHKEASAQPDTEMDGTREPDTIRDDVDSADSPEPVDGKDRPDDDAGLSDEDSDEPERDAEKESRASARDRRREEPSSSDDEGGSTIARVGKSLLAGIPDALQAQGNTTLDSILEHILDVIFSDDLRDAILRERREIVSLVLDTALSTIHDDDTRQDLRHRFHGELLEMLDDTIDTIFSGPVRRHLSVNLHQAITAAMDGDIGRAVVEIGEAFGRALGDIFDCLQEYFFLLLHIVMSIAFEALKETIVSAISSALPMQGAKDKMEGAGDDLRDKVVDAADRLRDNIEGAREDMKKNITEGLQSALSGSGGDRQIGQRPVTKPPSGRPPSGRPPSGRPPSARPPAADR